MTKVLPKDFLPLEHLLTCGVVEVDNYDPLEEKHWMTGDRFRTDDSVSIQYDDGRVSIIAVDDKYLTTKTVNLMVRYNSIRISVSAKLDIEDDDILSEPCPEWLTLKNISAAEITVNLGVNAPILFVNIDDDEFDEDVSVYDFLMREKFALNPSYAFVYTGFFEADDNLIDLLETIHIDALNDDHMKVAMAEAAIRELDPSKVSLLPKQ